MHTKAETSNQDPVGLKRSKPEMSNNNNNNESDTECFWTITKASTHPVVLAKINRLRRKDTDSKLYRELMYEIGTFLAYEATSDLSLNNSKTV